MEHVDHAMEPTMTQAEKIAGVVVAAILLTIVAFAALG